MCAYNSLPLILHIAVNLIHFPQQCGGLTVVYKLSNGT